MLDMLKPSCWANIRAYHSAIANLQRLDDVQQLLSCPFAHKEASAVFCRVIDLPSAIYGANCCRCVWNNTSQTHIVCSFGHFCQAESIANRLLPHTLARATRCLVLQVLHTRSELMADIICGSSSCATSFAATSAPWTVEESVLTVSGVAFSFFCWIFSSLAWSILGTVSRSPEAHLATICVLGTNGLANA